MDCLLFLIQTMSCFATSSAVRNSSSASRALKDQFILFGASGQIGRVIKKLLPEAQTLAWAEVAEMQPEELKQRILKDMDPSSRKTAILANGVTNPNLSENELMSSNLYFPQKVAKIFDGDSCFRMLTLGSIMENFPAACAKNTYLRSKLELGCWMSRQAKRQVHQFLHVRIHTIYGAGLRPYMFLGQMRDALMRSERFSISSGNQLREYHHVEDIADALIKIAKMEWNFGPILELNSGQPVQLKQLAQEVFKAFHREKDLEVGGLENAPGENFSVAFKRTPASFLPFFRDPIQGVICFLQEELGAKER